MRRKQPFNGVFSKLTELERQRLINRVLAWWHNYRRSRTANALGKTGRQTQQQTQKFNT